MTKTVRRCEGETVQPRAADSHFVDNLLIFGRLLRGLGLEVHVGRLLDLTEALQHVDVGSRDDVYVTCRALLVHRHEDLEIFAAAFAAFWRDHGVHDSADLTRPAPHETDSGSAAHEIDSRSVLQGMDARVAIDDLDADASSGALRTWSNAEVIADKDLADFTAEEMALARAAFARLVWSPGERRTRHWVAGRGSRIDLRRALARSVRTGGDVVTLPRRRRRMRPRPIVLLCDVSGSMDHYSRMLLQFVHAMGRRHRRFEAFLFSTRLTRITKELRTRHLDKAVAAVSRSVPDWSGGTRIGDALKLFHQRWARVVLHRGPVVVLISDGWDRGEPDVLRDQMARLQRSCHRLIWLNPLIGTTDYAPLTRGLMAALPFVDDFLPARTLTNLADLAVHLNTLRSG
ncbi:MAG: VWA domain-containing protein [Acidobacteria bacterium]|nr:VWA domain-containing protein [Acidobacteriota bacterium]